MKAKKENMSAQQEVAGSPAVVVLGPSAAEAKAKQRPEPPRQGQRCGKSKGGTTVPHLR